MMLTVLTATYNRAHTLERLYQSLCEQTDGDFEWVVIDDGSTDTTGELLAKWKSEGRIKLISERCENGGKHRAVNRGAKMASGDFIAIMDSDDFFLSDGVQAINEACSAIAGNGKIAGVFMSQGIYSADGTMIPNGSFDSEREYVDIPNYLRNKKKWRGDRLEVVKRELFTRYQFPEFEGERFIAESALWNKMSADGYVFRIHRRVVCVIEYMLDGLSRNFYNLRMECFQGYSCAVRALCEVSPMRYCFWVIWNYAVICRRKKLSMTAAAENIGVSKIKFLPVWLGSAVRGR